MKRIMPGDQVAYQMNVEPVVLKRLILECDIGQNDLAVKLRVSRALVNLVINRGYVPTTMMDIRARIETLISRDKRATSWLKQKGLKIQEVWKPLGTGLQHAVPVGTGVRMARKRRTRAIIPGDAGADEDKEVSELLTEEARKHFRLFRSPFQTDIRDVADIYMSDEHRYIEAAMIDAAKHGGFLAVIGEVGSGKSVIRKKVVAELNKDDSSRIIFPRMIDKTRITASSICDAMILDLSDESPKMRLEQKTRQVEKLLISRSKAGCHVCLMIEEAHDLSVRVLKLLKRFYEIEDGYKKSIGIILIGQPELGALFNEADHYDMREVIRRCQVAHIQGLNGNIKPYLALKFSRVKVDLASVMTDDAITALSSRLSGKDGKGRTISGAFPLTVNNKVTMAMNLAIEMGEEKVTESVVNSL